MQRAVGTIRGVATITRVRHDTTTTDDTTTDDTTTDDTTTTDESGATDDTTTTTYESGTTGESGTTDDATITDGPNVIDAITIDDGTGGAIDDIAGVVARMARRVDVMVGLEGALAVLDDTIATLHVIVANRNDDVDVDVTPRHDTDSRQPVGPDEAPTATEAADSRSVTTEQLLSSVLAEVMEVDEIPPNSNFFDDLGADSMVMAHFCARLRKHPEVRSFSIKEVYHHPTLHSLAMSVDVDVDEPPAEAAASSESPFPPIEPATPVSRWQYIGCGAAQLLTMLALAALGAFVIARGLVWVGAADGLPSIYARSALFGGGVFVAWSVLAIVAKWVLIGRSTATHFRVWGLRYVRFWLVRLLVRSNPLVAFVGTPIFTLYLRALGADIGRGVLILTRRIPAYPDLLTIGDHTVVRKDSSLSCYRADAGWIQTGPVTLGRDALVGESTVLDIYTSLGDGAQLGHSSALQAGQSVPDGESRQGTPALRRTDADYRSIPPTERDARRRAVYSSMQVLVLFSITLPVGLATATLLVDWRQSTITFLSGDLASPSGWTLGRDALIISIILYFGLLLVGLVFVCTVPRLLGRMVRPGEVYPLYGIRYWAHRAITRLTNVKSFTTLFGDSSYIVHYLYVLGYDVSFAEQTGANFGLNVKHDHPYCVKVGPGTMAADGLSIVNADYSSTSFRISPVTIGSHSFIGNQVAFPSQATVGDDCLMASKVLVPVEGDTSEHVGFLGSPNFEIPRKVERDREFDDVKHGDRSGELLSAKNRHNLATMGWFLLSRWFTTFVAVLVLLGAVDLLERFGLLAVLVAATSLTLFRAFFNVLVERASTGFKPLRPMYCSLYEPDNWRIERYWKLGWQPAIFNGTPFKSMFWRLLGVRIGKRVFDDGCLMTEKTMISVGDDCVLNAGSVIQPHSQEDGTLKSDYVAVGDGCTLGVRGLVHYGVTMGDGSSLDANAFAMKGTEVPPHSHWAENPAREVRSDCGQVAPTTRQQRGVAMTSQRRRADTEVA